MIWVLCKSVFPDTARLLFIFFVFFMKELALDNQFVHGSLFDLSEGFVVQIAKGTLLSVIKRYSVYKCFVVSSQQNIPLASVKSQLVGGELDDRRGIWGSNQGAPEGKSNLTREAC